STAPRLRVPELMDQPGLDEQEHALALTWLGRINVASRAAAVLWPSLERLAHARASAACPLRGLDLAAGGGDTVVNLANRAARSGLAIEIEGCALSDRAVAIADDRPKVRGSRARLFKLDALADPIPEGYDVLTCS